MASNRHRRYTAPRRAPRSAQEIRRLQHAISALETYRHARDCPENGEWWLPQHQLSTLTGWKKQRTSYLKLTAAIRTHEITTRTNPIELVAGHDAIDILMSQIEAARA